MEGLSSNRMATTRYALAAGGLALVSTAAARADTAVCSASDTSLSCRLTGLLHWLEAAAFVLGMVLIVVIGVAIHLFRKNRPSRKGER